MIPKIYECLSKDELREVLNYALVTKEHTVATDAHILVEHSTLELFGKEFVENVPEEGMLLGGDALREMAKKTVQFIIYNKNAETAARLGVINVLHNKGGKAIFEPQTQEKIGTFPNWKAVIPSMDDNLLVMAIGIDAKKALRLQNALATEASGISCYFTGEKTAILCKPINPDLPSARGLIMPMMINY